MTCCKAMGVPSGGLGSLRYTEIYLKMWGKNIRMFCHNLVMLSDEQMSKRWPFSLLNDEQMSNKVRVEHQPDKTFFCLFIFWVAFFGCM